jgi:CubicO group peptidase (beta-lactamase class C family)
MSKSLPIGKLTVLAAMLWAGAAAAAEPDKAAMEKAQQILTADASAYAHGSTTVGIVVGSKLVWTRSFGYVDEATKKPATADTVYRIGSITKQFTGVMLMQLADRGKLNMNDPVDKYFPAVRGIQGWPPPKPVTFLDLARHRAGLSREPEGCIELGADLQCPDVIGPVSQWEQKITAALPRIKFERAPDVAYSYSNVGYAILGAAMSHAIGQPYTTYVSQNILAPLGMTNTVFEPTPKTLSKLARGYMVTNGVSDPTLPDAELKAGRGYKVPNGALFTTVGDLAKFVSFEMGEGPESVLPHAVLAKNIQDAKPTNDPPKSTAYGIGIMKQVASGHTIIGHGGAVSGYISGAYFDPDAKVGVICLRSTLDNCGPATLKALVALAGG